MRKSIKRYTDKVVDTGGWKCHCCAPPPGKRRELFKKGRKHEERDALRIEYADLNSVD